MPSVSRRLARCSWLLLLLMAHAGVVSRAFAHEQSSGTAAAAQARPVAVAAVPVVAEAAALRIDGQPTDAIWQTAAPITTFVQREPSEGAPPSFRTEARIAFDDTTLYVAVRAFDPEPDRIIGFLTRRDTGSASDWIHVIVDSYHDRRTAYEFAVNPVGVKRDTYRYNDNNADDSWDAVWDVVTGTDAEGWHAEFRIPLSQLRFGSGSTGRIGFAVVRDIARLQETSTWPLLARSDSGYVSSFGDLTGVGAGAKSKRLELTPYVLAQVLTQPTEAGNPLQDGVDRDAAVGVDLKYALTPALNFTATVNPDFGQVEADPATVNLGAFETFFEERRPFFVEGSGTYRFNINCMDAPCSLFYSRRIGRQPRGTAVVPEGGYSVQPAQSTILGAGKLTGRIGNLSVGGLTAVTQEETADIVHGLTRSRQVVEPRTLYSVARARREYSDQSAVGLMFTSTNRSGIADPISFLPDTAVTGAVDYDIRFAKRYNIEGNWIGSTVRGSTAAINDLQTSNVHSYQRPDATHLGVDPTARSMNGHAGSFAFNKLGGSRVRFNSNVAYKTPGFDTNDLGFLRRADEINQSNWLQVRFDTPGRFVRTLRINFNQWGAHNFDGDRLSLGSNFNAHWTFRNFWSSGFGVNFNARPFDDRLTRGGPGGYDTGNVNSWQYMNTDDRKVFGLNWNSFLLTDRQASNSWEVEPRFVLRPTSALSGELGFRYTHNVNAAQWVEAVEDGATTHYTFAHLHQTTSAITVRANYTMRPTLSLQLYAQPFVSAGDYDGYKELVDGRADAFADRYRPYAYAGNADFRYLSFRSTNVLRWEFKPGSTLFVVYQQGREGSDNLGRFRFGRDYNDVFDVPATSTFLVKLAYWLNP